MSLVLQSNAPYARPLSPFDIPEIAIKIFGYISTTELVPCAHVNKTWNQICAPIIWRQVRFEPHNQDKLYKLFHDDYLQNHEANWNSYSWRELSSSSRVITTKLASTAALIKELDISYFIALPPGEEFHHGFTREKTPKEVIRHLIQLCTNLQRITVRIDQEIHASYRSLHGGRKSNPVLKATFDSSILQVETVEYEGKDVLIEVIKSLRSKVQGIHCVFTLMRGRCIADILKAKSEGGWRDVCLYSAGPEAIDVLISHCNTLESVSVRSTHHVKSKQLIQILASSPNLHTLETMEDSVDIGFDDVSVVEAKDFIDYNYELGTFRPWACESILRKLGIQIQGIPRPDVPNYIHGKLRKNSLQESNEEKSHGLQHQVFERLSRFSQLEKLMLGHYNSDYGNDYCYEDYPDGSMVYVDPSFQYECLDLSLRSGLTQLHTLKKLRFLGCARMSTNIGTDEIDWMVANWPLLAIVVGFKGNEEARKHLKTRYPEIEHELYYSYNG